jgi:hypothetical protein
LTPTASSLTYPFGQVKTLPTTDTPQRVQPIPDLFISSFVPRQTYPLGQVNTRLAADVRQLILPYTVGEVEK